MNGFGDRQVVRKSRAHRAQRRANNKIDAVRCTRPLKNFLKFEFITDAMNGQDMTGIPGVFFDLVP